MFGNETMINAYIISGILLLAFTSIFSKGLLSNVATVTGLFLAGFALFSWF